MRSDHLDVCITELSVGDVDGSRALGVSPIGRKFNIEFGDEFPAAGNLVKILGDLVQEFLKQISH